MFFVIFIVFIVGFIFGLFGIGGGVLFVLVMMFFFVFLVYIVVVILMFIVFLLVIVSFVIYILFGNVSWIYVLILIFGVWIGGKIGVYINIKLSGNVVINLLCIMLIIFGIRLIIIFFL